MCAQHTKPKQRSNRGGRPTKYTFERCAEIYHWMAKGHSIMGAAGAMGVKRQTLYNWQRRHPSFADAIKRGKTAAVLFWEQRLHNAQTGWQVNRAKFMLKHLAPEEFSPAMARQREKVAGERDLKELYKYIQGTAIRPRDCPDEPEVLPTAQVPVETRAIRHEEANSQAGKGIWTAPNGGYLIAPETVAEFQKRERRPNYRRRHVSAMAV
jgi:hypothetical protein